MSAPMLTMAKGALLNDALVVMASPLCPITVRGLSHQAVISAQLPFIRKDHDGNRTIYRAVQVRALKPCRRGAIDWNRIVDESRCD